jgi:hypothetical protein
MQKIYDCLAYSTEKVTWINSGAVPSQIAACLFRPDNVLVSSVAATSSGNGHYYALLYHDPSSFGNSKWVMQKWFAVINANTYVNAQFGKMITFNVGSP